ncbi:MAG TPA: hypothetical protein VIY27_07980 [Myxococcota bacterium]
MNLEVFTYVLVVAVNLTVGIRLLSKGVALGARPEQLLGATLTLDGIEWLFWVMAFYTPAADTPLAELFGALCRVFILAHNLCLLAFTRLVFRPESRGARGVVWVTASLIFVGLIGGFAAGDWMGNRSDHVWLWVEMFALMVAYAWTLIESSLYYSRMRRRVGHGLADPVLANRFLLWASYGAASVATTLVWMFGALVVAQGGRYPFALDAIMVGFTLVSALSLWLAFFPPLVYRTWVRVGRASTGA